MGYRIASLFAVPAVLLFSAAAFASGYIAMPERREKQASHAACVALLESTAAQHRKQVKPRTFNADGGFQAVYLEDISGGVKILGRNHARYEGTIWYNNGSLVSDGKQYEISASWDRTDYECRGRILIVNSSNGYTLSSFEPVPPKSPE